jgi:ectoine hydroxylase-related dioxygenase (phytanoyl-CoA dioxygenase family)
MPVRSLSSEQLALLPTDEDVAFYEANGYYVSKPGVIPQTRLDLARRGSERLYAGDLDRPLPTQVGYSRSARIDDTTPRNDEFVSLQIDELAAFVRYPLIGAIAARLARVDSIRLLDDQLVWKPPSSRAATSTVTGWHSDGAYWSTCSSSRLLTAWVPLHDIAPDGGPLVVMPGSHRWPCVQSLRGFNAPDLQAVQASLRDRGHEVEVVPLALRAGQLSFHHMWTVHGSLANRSGRPRHSYAIHLQDGGNAYRPYTTPDGREIHIFDESLCRRTAAGDPDFADPAVFPELWRSSPR